MTQQTVAWWAKKQWDDYTEQVRDGLPMPEVSATPLQQYDPAPIYYPCPRCLRDSTTLTIELSDKGTDFAATWVACGHRVSVPA